MNLVKKIDEILKTNIGFYLLKSKLTRAELRSKASLK